MPQMKSMLCLMLSAAMTTVPVSAAFSQPVLAVEKTSDKANQEFDEYLNQYVIDLCEDDYLTMHQYFEDPEKYGINPADCEITLGSILPGTDDEDIDEDLLEELGKFDYDSLSPVQQSIYDQLQWEYTLYQESDQEKFEYLGNAFSSMTGVQETLVTFFSEYEIRQEADIEPLLVLIGDVPRYVDECIQYVQEQAKRDMLYMSLDSVLATCDDVLDARDDSPVYAGLAEEIDSLNLDSAKAKEYKKQIKEALDQSFFPAYETMEKELKAMKKDIKEPVGLALMENGKEYYELLLKNATGCDLAPGDVADNLENAMVDIQDEYFQLMKSNSKALEKAENIQTDFKSVEEIMTFLQKNYTSLFPKVDTMHYELSPLSDSQSTNGIVAYFLIPPIDNTQKYIIRYNKRDYGEDPSAIDMYSTLAHEGIPGHMYQTQYDHQHLKYPIQYMLSNDGFSEGYATYVQEQALKFLDLDEDVAKAYQANETFNNFFVALLDLEINYYGMTREEFAEDYGEDMMEAYDQLADNPSSFLSYYYGYYEISQLRSKARESLGDKFDDVDFNNALLQYGSLNFEIITRSVDDYITQTKKEVKA